MILLKIQTKQLDNLKEKWKRKMLCHGGLQKVILKMVVNIADFSSHIIWPQGVSQDF